jgi:hypothetical protein
MVALFKIDLTCRYGYHCGMKTAGLSSKTRKNLRHNSKTSTFARLEEIQHAAREKQRTLRVQAERSRLASEKRESDLAAKTESETASPPDRA